MQHARVIGHATSTVKHETLEGWRLVVVQPLGVGGADDGPPMLAIDHLGSAKGNDVILTSDGKAVRELMKSNQTPVRWAILGIID